MIVSLFRAVVTTALALASSSSALADRAAPITTYVEIGPGQATVAAGTVESRVLYLNRCLGGCAITPGYEDSRQNHSSIIDSPVFIPELTFDDAVWTAIVECVRAMYADFDILVTDEDPGDTPHFEAIVAGRPSDAGFPYNVGGVAPFTCEPIENAITYTFAATYGAAPQQICHTIAQESAHALGLDHEFLCEDPMTYILGCGPKCFQDVDAPCGESGERQCFCGGARQNSWQSIRALFGDSTDRRQRVSILSPADGETVPVGFHVELGMSITCMSKVEAWVDDAYLGAIDVWPFILDTPLDLPEGPATIRAMATDRDGATTETTIEVVIGTPPNPPPPPPPDPVDAGSPAVDDPEPQADCGCATTGGDRDQQLGWSLLLVVAALGLRRRRTR